MPSSLTTLPALGQSLWLDNLSRGLITSGELASLIRNDGVLGLTSNPAIFEKAMASAIDYEPAFRALVAENAGGAGAIYERMAIQDIQWAADLFYPVWQKAGGRDGFVSLEVSPYLAHDTAGTVEEARRLHAAVARPNLMIKVPATPEGVPAIEELIAGGMNINVTLLFAVEAYGAVVEAYLRGLERLAAAGGDVSKVNSVASFFVSRIDTLIDDKLAKMEPSADAAKKAKIQSLYGKVAIANARNAYALYHELYGGARWKALAAKGAKPQRLLWASTSVKNPKYSPTMYAEELVGPDTVNTAPPETVEAMRKLTGFRSVLTENWDAQLKAARATMQTLADAGISMKEVTDFLLTDGVKKFSDAFDKLLAAVERRRQAVLGAALAGQTTALGEAAAAVNAEADAWRAGGRVRRLWAKDASLWSGTDEAKWMDWLGIVDRQLARPAADFRSVAEDAKAAGFRHVVVLGMGGSSLCPDVLARTFGRFDGSPELLVLDSTVPAQVRFVEKAIDPAKTLFFVSSKSGSTIEPNSFKQYFFDKVAKAVGPDKAGQHFAAVTDPGTLMNRIAEGDRFRRIFFGLPQIGGRFSALSDFGMAPAAAMGLDVPAFLASAKQMVSACGASVPPEVNPGVTLGLILGVMARRGVDKVTFVTSPGIGSLGGWLEQLIAESTGKEGQGVVPVDDEPLAGPDAYGADRLFVYLRLDTAPDAAQDKAVEALERAGRPVVRIRLSDPLQLAQEFFRWEIATAAAGAVLGINPFNQPDVEAAKIAARKVTSAYEQTGKLPEVAPLFRGDGFALYADRTGGDAIAAAARSKGVAAALAAHLARIKPGDYFAINAYVEMCPETHKPFQAVRTAIRDAKKAATTLGYGPRFLHSTGQLHKGGPNTGVFLHVTADDAEDLPIPGQKFGFSVLKQAQAQGDFEVLAERGRRILRLHIEGADVVGGLSRLAEMVRGAV
jgi:transaldolase/glucose-6-phosphate isomerase